MKSSKFIIHYYVLLLSLFLIAMPFYHQSPFSTEDLQPWKKLLPQRINSNVRRRGER